MTVNFNYSQNIQLYSLVSSGCSFDSQPSKLDRKHTTFAVKQKVQILPGLKYKSGTLLHKHTHDLIISYGGEQMSAGFQLSVKQGQI